MIIDMHCDTILKLQQHPKQSLLENNLAVDLTKLKTADYELMNFALFIYKQQNHDPYEDCWALYELFKNQMELSKDYIRQVTTVKEMETNRKDGLLSALLTIEEGAVCKGSTDLLQEFYDKGARMMTLTWNFENELGFPNSTLRKDGSTKAIANTENGLKPAGFEIIEAMESMGMIVDVSHLSDAGFWDVVSQLKGPFVASHSNSREICYHPRNLTDKMLRALGEKGGVSGLNLYGSFVNPLSSAGFTESRVEDLMKHAHRMADKGGIDCVAIGTDYDGFTGECELDTADKMKDLPEYLHQSGFTWDEVDKITHKNVTRVYREVLG